MENNDGQTSDHGVLRIETLLPRPRNYVWEVHEYLKTTPDGDKKLIELLRTEQWQSVKVLAPNTDDMALEFHRLLEEKMSACYEWKRVRRRSTDKPWLSDGLRKPISKRAAIFRQTGRSKKWKRLDKAIKKTLAYRKRIYNQKQKERLEACGRTGQWWSIAKYMVSDENPRPWSITDLNPDKTPADLASELADHFTSVTNQSVPLTTIPQSDTGPGLVRLLDAKQVSARLKKFKKPASRVNGDIPRGVVTQAAEALAIPLVALWEDPGQKYGKGRRWYRFPRYQRRGDMGTFALYP